MRAVLRGRGVGPLTLEAAEAALREKTNLLAVEMVEAAMATGRTLAATVLAPGSLPARPTSAVDGYAVMAGSESVLPVVGRIMAGTPPFGNLKAGEALFVATGAAVPPGAGVVRLEEAHEEKGQVALFRVPGPGENIRVQGEEVQEGEEVGVPGDVLGPGMVALFTALGLRTVTVRRRPRVGVLVTGTEISGDSSLEGHIPNTNGPWLESRLLGQGAHVRRSQAPDELTLLKDSAEDLLRDSDLFITTGGVSVGPKDLVREVAQSLGFPPLFEGVRARPGTPLSAFSRVGGPLWIALPGNPVAVAMGFDRLVAPILAALEGREHHGGAQKASLRGPLPENRSDLMRLVPSRLLLADGVLQADPSPFSRPGAVRALVGLGGWILCPGGSPAMNPGDRVNVWLSEGWLA